MQLNKIAIDGFGVLAQVEIDHLTSGVNVVYGSNGSGKTTVLQFLRGLFCNFDQARRQRLLPPLKGGHPGGAVEVNWRSNICEIIRHARPGHHDTLGIKVQHGENAIAAIMRNFVSHLQHDLVNTLFLTGGHEAHSLDRLVQLALRDGIELRTRRQEATWIAERIEAVEIERQDLFGSHPSMSNIELLEEKLRDLNAQMASELQKQDRRDAGWRDEVESLHAAMSRFEREANWLHEELQTIQSQLTAVHDRLWSSVEEIVEEVRVIESTVPAVTNEWVTEIAEIDQQIAHAQQVLRDLAGSRLRLTIASTNLTGTETPDQDVVFERQRTAITSIEKQAHRMEHLLASLSTVNGGQECICQNLQGEVQATLRSVKQQISLLCQELSRQQSASEQLLLLSQRDGVDRCEIELTREIQRLRLRRDDLVHDRKRTADERIQFRTAHESEYCGCESHTQYTTSLEMPQSTVRMERQTVVDHKVVRHSLARPADAADVVSLAKRKKELFDQWQRVISQVCDARRRLDLLNRQPAQFATDATVQQLRQEIANVEQQLADAREQWQSLAVLQSVLQKTKQKLNTEVIPRVIRTSSELLCKMTNGRHTGFRFDEQREELLVISDQGTELPIHALSRGTLEQSSLSFRLALWNEYRERGVDLPLVLDEVLSDSDEDRLTAAVETVVEFCTDDHQIIFLTCQEPLLRSFENAGISIRNLPGSRRERKSNNRLLSLPGRTSTPVVTKAESEADEVTLLDRIQPDEPYWLQTNAAVSLVPSLGEQMARRIGSIGVRTIGNLIDLDPENTEIPLDSLQISATVLRQWQAEARLLCCVPDLTARDAQIIVLCGIFSPSELAQADAQDLYTRFLRIRENQREYATSVWLANDSEWPGMQHFKKWISNGRNARSYRQAREWSNRRRYHSAHSHQGSHFERQLQGRSTRQRESVTSLRVNPQPQVTSSKSVKLHAATEAESTSTKEFRFYLNMDSPVVDAPSIGPRTAERLEKIGVVHVSDLVNRDAADISNRLKNSRLTVELIQEWQQQAVLVCRIPELRGHDAQVLVACGLTDADEIASSSPAELFAAIGPFVSSVKGQRLLRSAKTPDLEEVTEWINFARHSRTLKAA